MANRLIERMRLGHLVHGALRPDTVAVDILPCPDICEGEMVGTNADDRPISIVKLLSMKGLRAECMADSPR